MAKISVIIPLYNKGNYIKRALQSVYNQTWKDFEVIVIDDGSTDNGPEIVRAFNYIPIKIIKQINRGPGAARNHGIKISDSPFLSFLDADDEWLPDFLEKAIRCIGEKKVFLADHYCGEGQETFFKTHPDLFLKEGCCRLSNNLLPNMVKNCIDSFTQGNVVISRETLNHLGGYYEYGCTYGEDAYLWLKVLLNYPVKVCREPLMRLHYDSSELGYGRKTSYPVHALVKHPLELFSYCPAEYRPLLKRVLDYYALISIWRCMDQHNYNEIHQILRIFPLSFYYWYEFVKIYIKLLFSSINHNRF